MKKILSLLLLALIGVNIASAQVTATCNGKEVQDGDEIVFYAHADDFGEISINPENQGKEILFRSADGISKVAFKVNAQFPAEAIKDLTWCLGGSCTEIKTDDTRDAEVKSFLVTALGIHSNALAPGQYVDYPVQITVRKGMTTLFRFTVRFVYSEETLNKEMSHITTGIGSTMVQAQSVKFNGQALAYHFNAQAARQLNVYGTDGKLVKTATLTATDGQLSLAGLPKGVYVFHLTEGNATLQSGKVVLK